jgi:hypothetical protein
MATILILSHTYLGAGYDVRALQSQKCICLKVKLEERFLYPRDSEAQVTEIYSVI